MIAVSLGYFFIYRKATVQAEHYVKATQEVIQENFKKQNEQELVGLHSTTSAERAKVAGFLIPEDKVVDFIESIEAVGTDSNVELELSAISNDDDGISVRVAIEGAWPNVMNALMLIENLPLGLEIRDVRLDTVASLENAEGSSAGESRWKLSLFIDALTQAQVK
jgi:hypothetical protein